MPIPSYRQQQQQVQAAARPTEPEPEYTEADWEDAGAAQHRRRPVMYIVLGVLLGGLGVAYGSATVWARDTSASELEIFLMLVVQAIGGVCLLIGIIGKGVQIGMTSDRHRD